MDPLLYIERGLSFNTRKRWGRLLFIWSILFLSLAITSMVLELPLIYSTLFELCFLAFLSLYIVNVITKIIFLHLYKERLKNMRGASYEVTMLLDKSRLHEDNVKGLLNSIYGDEIMKRLGIHRLSLQEYMKQRDFNSQISKAEIQKKWMDLPQYMGTLHDHDEHFASYLRKQRVTRDDLLHAARLVHNIHILQKQHDRLWSRKQFHDLSPFEHHALKQEEVHAIFITSQALRNLSVLDDEERKSILHKVIQKAKEEGRKEIMVSDIMSLTK